MITNELFVYSCCLALSTARPTRLRVSLLGSRSTYTDVVVVVGAGQSKRVIDIIDMKIIIIFPCYIE